MKNYKQVQMRAWRRRMRNRKMVRGTRNRPRLSVFRSNRHIYAQLIDDVSGVTLGAISSLHLQRSGSLGAGYPGNRDAAKEVGAAIAGVAKQGGIETVRFDRGEYKYHGRVKALAEGAREAGLVF
jgi:large subunit ribosomal protein L18